MTIKLSAKFRDSWLGGSGASGGLRNLFMNGYLDIFATPRPTHASEVPGSTHLVRIMAGTPKKLVLGNAVSGVISKASTQTWSGTAINPGTAAWFRFRGSTITSNPASLIRIDGDIDTSGSDLNMSNKTIVAGAVVTIDSFTITLPES